MPIYVVGARNQRVQIPNQALAVSITGAVGGAALEVHGGPDQPVVRSSAHQVLLPSLAGRVTVAIRPVGTDRFGPDSVIHLAIAHDNPGDVDPVQVMFDPVDVSGDTGVTFAALSPNGAQIDIAVSAVADTPLSPLATAARTSARKVTGRGPVESGGSVVVAFDTSASMRNWFTDGSAAAAADIVVGVADAVGLRDVSAVLVGADVTKVSSPGAAGLAEAVRTAQPRWSAGARWARLAPGRTVVCADYPTSAVLQRFPVIVLSDDRRLDTVGARLPSPRPGNDATAELLAHPPVLDRITSTLVRALA
ncbi:hypothetical protein [Mycolicibacterium mageritense]|uniref:VWA domain-containing protein n=1 Tax=Mycolicibacterium mageritense TaxID=53462 RepID=A0AAI8TP76_MYCME|nr:hypothetical protein [Mycolicibacterium mageritense]OKH77539.1 hypothetical protein EB73_42315 [Mycobacterium sp. SWH-M3]TXI60514.1 MAG: hypothetical protein E6Q55_19275 [Mycolicibacterium mageritense]BDY28368.1 hypothetical protein hbim_02302 [Mycolicibacterium mageritense]